jgi:hypothetical protein
MTKLTGHNVRADRREFAVVASRRGFDNRSSSDSIMRKEKTIWGDRNMNAKTVLCLSMIVMVSPAALAIIAGVNVDIHMDKAGVTANDFHIEGRLKSGVANANWNSPPKLVGNINDLFPNFVYAITPDPTSPDQNEYLFKADWSGFTYQYCQLLHLGLFFDLECHNLVIDLVGWWTSNGRPIGGLNGGAVAIPGFIVDDQPETGGSQIFRILNDSQLFGGGGGGAGKGIEQQILEMDVFAMTREEAIGMFGSLEAIFPQLNLNGMQGQLPWMPVANARGPISKDNPLLFLPGSFFDVFLDIVGPGQNSLHPLEPIHIQPGGILLTRTLVAFVNNNGDTKPDFRWVWHMHEAHGFGDLGDAPDSTNHMGVAMTAYPPGGPMGVQANFPTVFQGPFPFGPMHLNPQPIHLGPAVSMEQDADLPPDMDGPTNILPPANLADQDGFDDGVLPFQLKPCQMNRFQYIVTVNAPVVPQMFVNVWFDWNRDGDWDDTLQCAAGVAPAPEWAVQNQPVPIGAVGQFVMVTPPFMAWFPAGAPVSDTWMRITIAEQPWIPPMPPTPIGYAGSGPQGGYQFGETEDYFLKFEFPPDQDFGDAPDGFVPGYPTLLANNGARHTIVPGMFLGNLIDAEFDGQPNANATGDDLNNLKDEDGVAFVAPLIAGQPAKIIVTASANGLLQAWFDYNQNKSWGNAGEQIATDLPLVPGPNPINFVVPAAAVPGQTFARFRFSSVKGLSFFGSAPDGEVEDYMVTIRSKRIVETDIYPDMDASMDLLLPNGTQEMVNLNGQATTNVYFEGGAEGTAYDDNGNGLDEVQTELVVLNLNGNASVGPIIVGLNPQSASTGQLEEQVNNTPGILDVPPFAPTGTVNSFFDIWPQITMGGVSLTTAQSIRLVGLFDHKPAGPCTTLLNPDPAKWYDLVDKQGNITGIKIRIPQIVLVKCPMDFGDAPDGDFVPGYPTLLINNGARHTIVKGITLGALIDGEKDGQPDATATGDDLNNLSDEDGVKFLTWPLIPGKFAKVQVTASVTGSLFAWIDFNADSSWAQPGDQIAAGTPLAAGPNILSFLVPITAKPNCDTFARFRFTTAKVKLSYVGAAPDGEVEDYLVKIGNNCGIKWLQIPDTTPNGIDVAVDQQWTLADDFLCTSYDKITDVHLWGSWLQDKKGVIKKIHLSIHSDDPVGPAGTDPQNEWSKPDKLLWQMDFFPGDFTEQLYARLPDGEFWWDPIMDVGPIPGGDHEIWQVNIKINPDKAFLQQGSPDKPIVYWLDVHVDTADGRFGWKTRRFPDHFNDDAVATLANQPALFWHELRYPPGHPYYQMELNSIDMAFAITSRAFCCGSADLNCDGLVDLADFAIFASQWLQVAP